MKVQFRSISVLFGLILLAGCQQIAPTPTPPSIPAVGSALQQSRAYALTAQGDYGAALAHADEIGKALMARGAEAIKSLLSKLDDGMEDVAQVQTDFDTLAKSDQKVIADQKQTIQKNADATKMEIAKRDARIKELESSWGYRFQMWVTWAKRILIALIAIHIICLILGLVLPPPYSTIAGVVGKIVNPFGWLIWLVSHVQQNAAIRAAESGAASKVFPGAI